MTKLLKFGFFSGILLGAGLTAGLVILTMASDREGGGDPFRRALRIYDVLASAPAGGETPELLSRRLDRLEKQTQSVESWLSVLKRRRALALRNSGLIPAYREAARRAAGAYPHSEPLAALAAAAILYRDGSGGDAEAELRNYLVPVSRTSLSPLALGIRILLGDLSTPARRAAGPSMTELLSAALPLLRLSGEEREALTADMAILLVLEDRRREVAAVIQGFLSEEGPHSENFLRLAAGYHYDFGDPLQAAGLYGRIRTEEAMARSADALVLAGRHDAAKNIWRILIAPVPAGAGDPGGTGGPGDTGDPGSLRGVPFPSPAVRDRSLYNLAASTGNEGEAAALFERLFLEGRAGDPCRGFALIRYTRLLDTPRSLAILEDSLVSGAGGSRTADPLLDLELLRRRREFWTIDRIVAETWLLLGRHEGEERLYQWGAWFFNYQRRYDETAMLLKTAALHHFEGPWIPLAGAIERIARGRLDEGEAILRSVSTKETDPRAGGGHTAAWQAGANLGRILESRLAPAEALEWYERAAGRAGTGEAASRLQVRIALCLKNLGRPGDSRRALEYALDLNPDNLGALLELRRLEDQTRRYTEMP